MQIRELLECLDGHGVTVDWDAEDRMNDAILHAGMLWMEMQGANNLDCDIVPASLLPTVDTE